jgi:hypothetical protein
LLGGEQREGKRISADADDTNVQNGINLETQDLEADV